MGRTLWGYSEGDGDDYEFKRGHGKNKQTTGRKGGWDYTKERNFGTGGGSNGCVVSIIAGIVSALAGAPAVLQALHDSVGVWT